MPIKVEFPSIHDFWNLRRKHETGNYRIVSQTPVIVEFLTPNPPCLTVLHEFYGVIQKHVVAEVEVGEE